MVLKDIDKNVYINIVKNYKSSFISLGENALLTKLFLNMYGIKGY